MRLLAWNVGSTSRGPYGHVYGWEMTAVGPDETEVTNYCEWSNVPGRREPHFPIVPLAMLQKSVDNLAALVSRGAQPPG